MLQLYQHRHTIVILQHSQHFIVKANTSLNYFWLLYLKKLKCLLILKSFIFTKQLIVNLLIKICFYIFVLQILILSPQVSRWTDSIIWFGILRIRPSHRNSINNCIWAILEWYRQGITNFVDEDIFAGLAFSACVYLWSLKSFVYFLLSLQTTIYISVQTK